MSRSHAKFSSVNGKRCILVADDELINREMLSMILSEDYEVLPAADGTEALRIVSDLKDRLSLVLLDLLMPGISGLELLETMQNDPEMKNIPVIVATSDQSAEIECLKLGASDFISKPYPQPGVILARVQRTIELREDRQTIRETERDPLTGLYNREYFYSYAEKLDRKNPDLSMDAVIVDVNHFRMLNERYGRDCGDRVLRNIADSLRESAASFGGIVCRKEGDAFYLYGPSGQNYTRMLENASRGVSASEEQDVRVRLRMGVYADADKTIDLERRFDRAKMAADRAKNSFQNNIGLYDSALHERELFEEQLIEEFHEAIANRQFTVYYQPKYDVRHEEPILSSAEALVRWKHPTLGMISPGVFIPLFEENGLIQELDRYVWAEAARQIREWKEKTGEILPVSVNVSRVDMYDPNLTETMRKILKAEGLTPEVFYPEITESAYTTNPDQIVSTAASLRAAGFQIEMDDFGAGYSSLNMLSKLPLDVLKLDMQFVRSAFQAARDTRMIEVVIDIARHLGVPVVAEGVETEEQMLALKELGCDIIQGYYFSKPVPAEEFEAFIRSTIEKREEQKAHGGLNPEDFKSTVPEDEKPEETKSAEPEEALKSEENQEKIRERGVTMQVLNITFASLSFIFTGILFIVNMIVIRGYQEMEPQTVQRLLEFMTILSAVMLGVGFVLVFFIRYQIRKPLELMVEKIQERKPVPEGGARELRYVSRTYNRMLEEIQKRHQALTYEASHDALTGIYNRAAYDMFMESVDKGHIALLIIDMDYTKQVNDTYGHDMGDRVLKKVANLLCQSFRSVDIICRIGGDEFAVIMTRANSSMRQLVIDKVARINERLQNPDDGLPKVSVSVGVAFSDRRQSGDDIFKDADKALYLVKKAGRCGCRIYE